MPAITCLRCGGMTNTAVADWLDSEAGNARRCFVRWVDGVAEKGCAYDEGSIYDKNGADWVLANPEK